MNPKLTLDEYYEMKTMAATRLMPMNWSGSYNQYFMGARVVFPRHSNVIVIFNFCEYCGSKILDKNDCCASCSAPAYL